ncbi:regulator of protease activity HflC (stomatin/prohibitin superfamily) [Halarchaeum rubridurum]|uniref:Phosphoesterase n=1 Tax=Halarchaeum rubridurum TaxID=489911 RepID=A0A830FKG6_9EURY|nr:SPFH domain-containing protein [Halarchaeum rubridurum]MBP1954359.1 regulator of protease activity HflC (stomatin/prohibitin superfamily) [Halarchaeum rubridurum]GGM59427.1 phosphoesterase [Halarchaeum rubridurum]
MSGAGDESMRRFFRALGRASARVRRWHLGVGTLALSALLVAASVGTGAVLLVLALSALVVLAVESIELVQAYERRPYTVFGAYEGILGPGINLVVPFVTETYVFDTRTQTVEVPTQEAITRDNSPVRASAVVYLSVVDAEKAFLEIDGYRDAVAYLAQTSLRATIGDMELDATLSERAAMNERIHEQLDETVAAWGVAVEAVEVKRVMPSEGVVSAMERQTAAERHRRAAILEARGARGAAVERALGERTAAVLRAEGAKRASILEAQGDAAATVLRARAAEAMGERALIDRGFDALERVGAGAATTYVVPQELTSLVGRYGRHAGGTGGKRGGGLDANPVDLVELDLADVIETPADAEAVEIEVE